MSMTLNAVITEEAGGFVAMNPDTGVASQGDTLNESLENLREALTVYLEEVGSNDLRSQKPHQTFLTTVSV